VVTVGDQHGTVPHGAESPGVPVSDRYIPASSRDRLGPGHLGPELDHSPEAEMIHEIIKILCYQLMA
jgi:hypothetical protein